MVVKFLQANNGDSILISFVDEANQNRNILIDGGTSATYQYKDKKTSKILPGDLKKSIENLKKINQKIDLLILTHVDDDHIAGLLKWFANDESAKNMIGEIWFNSGRYIFQHFKTEEIKTNLVDLKLVDGTDTSIKDGVKFEDYIFNNKLWQGELITAPMKIPRFGIEFNILSPTFEKLKPLLYKWEKEHPDSLTSKKNDYNFSIEDLISKDEFKEDDAVHNGSSIAFLMTYKAKNMLFLGDSHPSEIITNLSILLGKEKLPLAVEFVKLSHHGSKFNTNYDLLKLITCNNFIVSSNGKIHNLPDKQCLARIINYNSSANIYFNYKEKISEIFSQKDHADFKLFKALETSDFIIQ